MTDVLEPGFVKGPGAGMSVVVAEVFGPTFQGEGPSTGRQAMFVRLGGCNLSCTWCDTPYTWDASRFDLRKELTRVPVNSVLARVAESRAPLTVVTGGEPLLHQRTPGWTPLVQGLADLGDVEVETNGTVLPTVPSLNTVTRWNVSPKLAHAGGTPADRIRRHVLRELAETGRAVFKFVVRDDDDLDHVQGVVTAAGIRAHHVWIMPEGVTPEVLMARGSALADPVLARGWNLTQRMHVFLWPDEDKGR